jgi:hypothetical protein
MGSGYGAEIERNKDAKPDFIVNDLDEAAEMISRVCAHGEMER